LAARRRNFARTHRRRIQLDSGVALAFDLLLDPGKDFGVHRLRTGVSAPQSSAHGGEQEQRVRGNDQQNGKEKHILRPEDQAEYVELAFDQIEQHGLAPVPGQPADAVEDQLGYPDQCPTPGREDAADGPGMHLLVNFVKALLVEFRLEFDRGNLGL
jgi:hypothetical protein